MIETVFNTGSSSVVVDFEGRHVHGHDWGTVETTADEVKQHLKDKVLLVVPEVAENADQRLKDAVARTAVVAERAEAAQALDKDVLADLLRDHRATKPQLVWLAANLDVDLPDPPAADDEVVKDTPPADPPADPEPPKKTTPRRQSARSTEGN